VKRAAHGRCAVVLLLMFGAAGVGGYTWWHHRVSENETVSDSLCSGILQTHDVSQAMGLQATGGTARKPKTHYYFDCEIKFERNGLYVSYLDEPYFIWTQASYEDDVKALATQPGYSVTQMDTGLDGHTYMIIPGEDGGRATCVWYSDTGRTLTITTTLEQDQISDDELPPDS